MAVRSKVASFMLAAILGLSMSLVVSAKELSASSDPAELRAFVRRIAALSKPTAQQLRHQASAQLWLMDFSGAVKTYGRAIKLKPDDSQAFLGRAVAFKMLERYPDALKDLEKAESLGYDKPGLFGEKMVVLFALKDYAASSSAANQYIMANPSSARAFYVKGQAEFLQGNSDEGLKLMDKAIELDPMNASYVQARGESLEELGRKEAASRDYAKAKELGWK